MTQHERDVKMYVFRLRALHCALFMEKDALIDETS